MKKLAVMFAVCFFAACGSSKSGNEEATRFDEATFSKSYAPGSVPFTLTDTFLLKNKDTARIDPAFFATLVADSIKQQLFSKNTNIRYIPLYHITHKNGEQYYITKATNGTRTVALVSVIKKGQDSGSTMPFLVPDADVATQQSSSIDKAFSISRNISRKMDDETFVDGKNVYAYNDAVGGFTLIMTDALEQKPEEIYNPIDTFSKHHRFSGDYVKSKKSFVSIRDGRNEKELQFFVHFEKEDGCIGELKGFLFMTAANKGVFRQTGGPCVVEFDFKNTGITLKEVDGCGAQRGVKCSFDDTYPRKQVAKPKTTKRSGSKK